VPIDCHLGNKEQSGESIKLGVTARPSQITSVLLDVGLIVYT
jgi:hypothetical protein